MEFTMLERLRAETGCEISECEQALEICGSYDVAYEYLRLKSQAVCRYKYINGKKIRWAENDYIERAKQAVLNSMTS